MTSRWNETSSLEILLGSTLVACGFHLLITDANAIPIYSYGVMAATMAPVKWSALMILTGLLQIVSTVINGHGISWTPITRLICCSTSTIVMSILTYLKFTTAAPTTIAFSVFLVMAVASLWCGLVRANIVWERFSNEAGD